MIGERAGRANSRLKHLRRLVRDAALRRAEGSCVLEGRKLVREWLDSGAPVRLGVASLDIPDDCELLGELSERAERLLRVDEEHLASLADTRSPQGWLLLVDRPATREIPPARERPLLLGWELQDPGNAGALLRAAAASGCAAVVWAGREEHAPVDPFSPRALRAAAGAAFRLPTIEWQGPAGELAELLESLGWTLSPLLPRGGEAPERVDLSGPTALVVGSEAHGLPEALASRGRPLSFPLEAGVESLGAAAAGALACFEAARQRRLARARDGS